MKQLQKDIYDLLPDELDNVLALDISKTLARFIETKADEIADEIKTSLSGIRIDTPTDSRVISLAIISVDDAFNPLTF